MINIDKLYSSGFIEGEITYSEWFPWHKYKEIANKLQGCMYNIVHSETKPTKNPWEWDEKLFIRIGTTCGKGYGFTDKQADNKYFDTHSKGTTQPKDRLDDHVVNMRDGMDSTHAEQTDLIDEKIEHLEDIMYRLTEFCKTSAISTEQLWTTVHERILKEPVPSGIDLRELEL